MYKDTNKIETKSICEGKVDGFSVDAYFWKIICNNTDGLVHSIPYLVSLLQTHLSFNIPSISHAVYV